MVLFPEPFRVVVVAASSCWVFEVLSWGGTSLTAELPLGFNRSGAAAPANGLLEELAVDALPMQSRWAQMDDDLPAKRKGGDKVRWPSCGAATLLSRGRCMLVCEAPQLCTLLCLSLFVLVPSAT